MRKTPSKKFRNTQRNATASPARSKIQNVLATTDLSNGSLAGVRCAVALAEKVGAPAALLHVVEFPPPPPPMPGMRTVSLSLQDSKVDKHARVRLRTLAKRESKADLNLTPILRSGNSFYGIITTARERATDLIVIATHGYTGAKRVLLGSTTERVVRHAPCSVLTVPARATPRRSGKTPRLELKKILVPIDFSEISKEALAYAAFLAGQFGADIILLHVTEKAPINYLLGPGLMNHLVVPMMKQAEADLAGVAGSLSKNHGARLSVVVRQGRPFEEICRAARTLRADLIVLTTHGYTGLKHVVLGSTAERVVRHADCPVLVVRAGRKRSCSIAETDL